MTNLKINQSITFKTRIFGEEITKTNVIKFIEEINGETIYFVSGLGKLLLGRDLKGKEDCFQVTKKNIIE
tara:strand:- start:5384 stop:5593 length:210 start_codon:yes stop_codon:yes gene_type:complete